MNYWYVNLLGLLFFIFPCSGNAQSRTSLQDEVIKEWNNYSLEGATVESILKQRAAVEKMILARDKKDEMARLANQVKAINYYEELGTIRSSEISGFSVDNLYLSGKDSHRYRTGINCKRIFWNPLAKDAELELTLRQKGEIILNR